eukprot:jgi/Astpho2/6554/Aster-x1383
MELAGHIMLYVGNLAGGFCDATGLGHALAGSMEDNPTPFKGEPNVPHVSEEFFKVYWLGSQLAVGMMLAPGKVLGSEVRPKKFNADYVIAACDEAAMQRELKPTETRSSWVRMFWNHLHHKSWMLDREGGGYMKHA